jgi:hypothetical protein
MIAESDNLATSATGRAAEDPLLLGRRIVCGPVVGRKCRPGFSAPPTHGGAPALLCAKPPFEQARQGASIRAQMLDWFKQTGPEPGGFYQYYKTLVEELSRLADSWACNAIGEVRPR